MARLVRIARGLCGFLSLIFFALVIFGFNSTATGVLTLLAALIHELGHIFASLSLLEYSEAPRFVLSGLRLKRPRNIAYRDEIIITAAGPAFNFIAFLILLFISAFCGRYFLLFAMLNLFTAISNLLPIKSFDGYRILLALSGLYGSSFHIEKILYALSFALTALLTFLSLYLIMRVGEGYWIFAIYFSSLLGGIFERLKNA